MQQDMMETRLTREMEKSRSMLSNAGASSLDFAEFPPTARASSGPAPAPEYSADHGLTEDQIQMFEEGNQDMMQHFESALDKVRYVVNNLR